MSRCARRRRTHRITRNSRITYHKCREVSCLLRSWANDCGAYMGVERPNRRCSHLDPEQIVGKQEVEALHVGGADRFRLVHHPPGTASRQTTSITARASGTSASFMQVASPAT